MKTSMLQNSSRPVRSLLIGLLLSIPTAGLVADEAVDSIVTRARAWVGPEESVAGITSLHYSGELEADGEIAGTVDIIFQKPHYQLIVVQVGNVRETTALSGYDGWRKVEDVNNPADWELTLLEADQIRRLKANVSENLNYYRFGPKSDVAVLYLGEVEVDGVTCEKISFEHGNGIRFVRYFDPESGRLVQTETEQGGQIREEGEIIVSGLRFPERVVTSINGEGSTILFKSVEVNVVYDEELFDVPMLLPNTGG